MTIATTQSTVTVQGNGATINFNYGFLIPAAGQFQALYTDAAGTVSNVTANTTVNNLGTPAGGTFSYQPGGSPMLIGSQLTLNRVLPLTQGSSLQNQGNLYPTVIETALDYLTMVTQQITTALLRVPTLPSNLDYTLYTMTLPAPLANAIIGWDPTGKILSNIVQAGGIPLPLPVNQGGTGAATAPAALTNLGFSAFVKTLIAAATAAAYRALLLIDGISRVISAGDMASSMMGFSLINGTLVPSQNGTVLTVAIKTLAGADPSAADPVYVLFRNVTAGTGDYTVIALTAANSIATTVGGTFGVANGVSFRLWVVGFNDGGIFRLGLINCLTTVAGAGAGRAVTALFPLAGWGIASSTLIGAGSTLSQTFYSAGAGVASKAYATLGYLTYEAGLAAAGTFGVNQSRCHMHGLNDPLPGHIIQMQRTDTGAVATGATTVPADDTIPQNTEGDQYMSQVITPSSAANALRVMSMMSLAPSTNSGVNAMSIFQDAVANALVTAAEYAPTINGYFSQRVECLILAALSIATTFKIRNGNSSVDTMTFNGAASARSFGGVFNSFIEVQEIMA